MNLIVKCNHDITCLVFDWYFLEWLLFNYYEIHLLIIMKFIITVNIINYTLSNEYYLI